MKRSFGFKLTMDVELSSSRVDTFCPELEPGPPSKWIGYGSKIDIKMNKI